MGKGINRLSFGLNLCGIPSKFKYIALLKMPNRKNDSTIMLLEMK